jgi:hypothetical protein
VAAHDPPQRNPPRQVEPHDEVGAVEERLYPVEEDPFAYLGRLAHDRGDVCSRIKL